MEKEPLPEDVRAIFRGYAARRMRETRPCAECGTIMERVSARRRYCSPRCLMRARRRQPPTGAPDAD